VFYDGLMRYRRRRAPPAETRTARR
jgi:hypothetical protein